MGFPLQCPQCGGPWDDVGLRVDHHTWCKRSRFKPDGSRRSAYPFEASPARPFIVGLELSIVAAGSGDHSSRDARGSAQDLHADLEGSRA